jgi:hypothetical protein
LRRLLMLGQSSRSECDEDRRANCEPPFLARAILFARPEIILSARLCRAVCEAMPQ